MNKNNVTHHNNRSADDKRQNKQYSHNHREWGWIFNYFIRNRTKIIEHIEQTAYDKKQADWNYIKNNRLKK